MLGGGWKLIWPVSYTHLDVYKRQPLERLLEDLFNNSCSTSGNLEVSKALDLCSKSFTQQSGLSEHKLIHSGIKKYQCDLCSKSFTRSSTLLEHKSIHSSICLLYTSNNITCNNISNSVNMLTFIRRVFFYCSFHHQTGSLFYLPSIVNDDDHSKQNTI